MRTTGNVISGRTGKSFSAGQSMPTGQTRTSGGMGNQSGGTGKTVGGTGKTVGVTGKSIGTGRGNRSGGTGRKVEPGWMSAVRGVCLSAVIFVVGTLLLGLGILSGAVDSDGSFPAMAAVTGIAAFMGGFCAAKRAIQGKFAAALAAGILFALILCLCALTLWKQISWTGHGGTLLLCLLAGSTLAGVAGQWGGRRKKRAW